MSTEIRAGFECPHLVMEEPVSIGDDGRSLITRAPVANVDSVFILVNDTEYIPASGLYSSANLSASSAGPYRIQRCVGTVGPDGDLLEVSTSAGFVSIRIPTGERITAVQIERQLLLATGFVIPSVTGGVLSLMDAGAPGLDSFVRVSGGAASSLGFTQRGARGKELYPAWVLASRADMNPVETLAGLGMIPARYPKFVKPLVGNPTLKVTYSAMRDRCPRCGGSGIENDYRFDIQGDVVTIQNENLLYQTCLKAILTIQGTNPYHPSYGSKVSTRIGAKATSSVANQIREDIQNALQRTQSLQRAQAKYQFVSDKERLYAIRDIQVYPDASDRTVYRVLVTVSNGTGKPVVIDIAYSVPGVVALAGTNGLALGLERSGLTLEQSRRFLLE